MVAGRYFELRKQHGESKRWTPQDLQVTHVGIFWFCKRLWLTLHLGSCHVRKMGKQLSWRYQRVEGVKQQRWFRKNSNITVLKQSTDWNVQIAFRRSCLSNSGWCIPAINRFRNCIFNWSSKLQQVAWVCICRVSSRIDWFSWCTRH